MEENGLKKGIITLLLCFTLWGFQPLYWSLCQGMDTFFLMACRIIWAAVCCIVILLIQGKLPQLIAVFKDRKTVLTELAASVFLFADWVIYLWAVRNGRVMECSLGYYIEPIAVFAFGALVFHEKTNWKHFLVLGLIVIGIALSVKGFGGMPYVTIALALCFACYAAIKKSLSLDSIVSTTSEIVFMVPVAVIYMLIFCRGEGGLGGLTAVKQLLLCGSGVVTALPMLFYAISVKHLPLITIGIFQYLSPTISLFCGALMGESFSEDKLISFAFIWLGVIIYIFTTFGKEHKKESMSSGQ